MNKKMIRVSISFCVLVILIGIGISYAYFAANFYNSESQSTIKVGSATLELSYENDTGDIVVNGVEPGWVASKYFTINSLNTTGKSVTYNIKLMVDGSNFYTEETVGKGSLYYSLYSCTEKNGEECTNLVEETVLDISSGSKTVYVASAVDGDVYYRFILSYKDDTENIQSQYGTDGNLLSFSGYISVDSDDKIYQE